MLALICLLGGPSGCRLESGFHLAISSRDTRHKSASMPQTPHRVCWTKPTTKRFLLPLPTGPESHAISAERGLSSHKGTKAGRLCSWRRKGEGVAHKTNFEVATCMGIRWCVRIIETSKTVEGINIQTLLVIPVTTPPYPRIQGWDNIRNIVATTKQNTFPNIKYGGTGATTKLTLR